MITSSFNPTPEQVSQDFIATGERVVLYLTEKINSLTLRLQQKIQRQKLEGQVLHHRSGKLSSSVRMLPARLEANAIIGVVEGGGGPAWYGRIHEFGGDFQASRHSTAKFGKGITKTGHRSRKKRAITQRLMATVYTIHFPERSFMRSALGEMRQTITAELKESMKAATGK